MKSSQFEREQQHQSDGRNNFNLSKAPRQSSAAMNGLHIDDHFSALNRRHQHQHQPTQAATTTTTEEVISRSLKLNNNDQQQQPQQILARQVHILAKQNSANKKQFNDNSRATTTTTIYGNNDNNKFESENSENYHHYRRGVQQQQQQHWRPGEANSDEKSLKFNPSRRNNKIKQSPSPSSAKENDEDEIVLRDDEKRNEGHSRVQVGVPRREFGSSSSSGSPIVVVVSHQFSGGGGGGGNNLISVPANETSPGKQNGVHLKTTTTTTTSAFHATSQLLERSKVCSTINNNNHNYNKQPAAERMPNTTTNPSIAILQQQQQRVNNHNNHLRGSSLASNFSNSNHHHHNSSSSTSSSSSSSTSSYLSIGSTKSSTADTTTSGFSSEAGSSSVQTLGRQVDMPSHMNVDQPNKQQPQQKRSIRSRLIEDLDRLERIAAAVAANQGAMATMNGHQTLGARHNQQNYCSNTTSRKANTLRLDRRVDKQQPVNGRSNEFDDSTLCRDEFSSFIATCGQPDEPDAVRSSSSAKCHIGRPTTNNQPSSPSSSSSSSAASSTSSSSSKRRRTRSAATANKSTSTTTSSGPTLVGVHECSSVGSSPASRPVESIDSHSPSSIGTPDDDDDDDEVEGHDHDDQLRLDLSGQIHHQIDPMRMYNDIYRHQERLQYQPEDHRRQQQHCEVQVEEYFSDESEQHRDGDSLSSIGSARNVSLKCQDFTITSQPNDCQPITTTTTTTVEEEPIEHEPLVSDEMRAEGKDLSLMLDVYLKRVESLLRLASGDKLVTIGEAFGGKDIQVSDEHQTGIEFTPSQRPNSRRVVQEIELIVESPTSEDVVDEVDNFENNQRYLMTNIVAENFRSLLSSLQTSAKLNWWPCEPSDLEVEFANSIDHEKRLMIDEERLKSLESSLAQNWLDSSNDGNESHSTQRRHSNPDDLVRTIKGHINEFVANYNAYQRKLLARAEFASDWHQNWLFAYKRPHWSLSDHSDLDHDTQQADCKSSSPKQAKLSSNNDQGSESTHRELLNYSTLLLDRNKTSTTSRLSYLLDSNDNDNNNDSDKDQLYNEQQNAIDELKSISIESGAQVDICRLLINDLFADEDDMRRCDDENNNNVRYRKTKRKSLEIRYESSLDRTSCANFRLFACGHLIESSKLREFSKIPLTFASCSSEQKSLHLRKLIMMKLLNLTTSSIEFSPNHHQDHIANNNYAHQDQVKFLVNLTNVELINQLPVIQFCAKIGGALPIKVSWFKLNDDESKASDSSTKDKSIELNGEKLLKAKRIIFKKQHLLANDSASLDELWPISMHAKHDFEYQNDWSSWFRFKRSHDDILFEIRDADEHHDYNKIYKCVIENYCSRKECRFSLRRRPEDSQHEEFRNRDSRKSINSQKKMPNEGRVAGKRRAKFRPGLDHNKQQDELDQVKLRELSHETGNQEAGHALLRTWSQRTLNRHAKSAEGETGQQHGANDGTNNNSMDEMRLTSANQQTVGRMSSRALDELKLGADFPYHPENLIKRLEENKYSISMRSAAGATLKRQQTYNNVGGNGGGVGGGLHEIRATPEDSQVTFSDDKSSRLEADYQNINSNDQEQHQRQVNYADNPESRCLSYHHHNHHSNNLSKPTNERQPQQVEMQFEELTSSSELVAPPKGLPTSGEQIVHSVVANETMDYPQTDACQPNQSLAGVTWKRRANQEVGGNHQPTSLVEVVEPKPRLRATKVAQTTADNRLDSSPSNQQQQQQDKHQEVWRLTRTSEHEIPPDDADHQHQHQHRHKLDQQELAAPDDRQQSTYPIDGQRRAGQKPRLDSVIDYNNGHDDDDGDKSKRRQLEMNGTQLTSIQKSLASGKENLPDPQRQQQQQVHLNRPQACSRHVPAGAVAKIGFGRAEQPSPQVASGDDDRRHKVADNRPADNHHQPQRPPPDREELRPKASVKSLISRFNMA